jgi:hypothetical protein
LKLQIKKTRLHHDRCPFLFWVDSVICHI